ncbi:MAG: leucine-rich repeat domain-containing protein [Deltaproteobacteria bacterium]
MTEFEDVLAHPRSVTARRSLLRAWIEQNAPQARLLELALAAHDGDPAAHSESARLVRKHGRELAGPIADEVEKFEFGMGLVAWIKTSADEFIRRGSDLTARAPLLGLLVVGERKHDVMSLPPLGQILELAFFGPGIDDDLARAVASSPHCRELRTLRLSNGTIGSAGLAALTASGSLPNIVSIDLTGNPCAAELTQLENGGAFFVGPAGEFYWAKARDAQFFSSDSFNPANFFWPPSFDSYAWTD